MENPELDYSKKDNRRHSEVLVALDNGNRIMISGDAELPDTILGVLIKAVSAQVIFESNHSKSAPNEIWAEVEKSWSRAKAEANNYKIVSNTPRSGQIPRG